MEIIVFWVLYGAPLFWATAIWLRIRQGGSSGQLVAVQGRSYTKDSF